MPAAVPSVWTVDDGHSQSDALLAFVDARRFGRRKAWGQAREPLMADAHTKEVGLSEEKLSAREERHWLLHRAPAGDKEEPLHIFPRRQRLTAARARSERAARDGAAPAIVFEADGEDLNARLPDGALSLPISDLRRRTPPAAPGSPASPPGRRPGGSSTARSARSGRQDEPEWLSEVQPAPSTPRWRGVGRFGRAAAARRAGLPPEDASTADAGPSSPPLSPTSPKSPSSPSTFTPRSARSLQGDLALATRSAPLSCMQWKAVTEDAIVPARHFPVDDELAEQTAPPALRAPAGLQRLKADQELWLSEVPVGSPSPKWHGSRRLGPAAAVRRATLAEDTAEPESCNGLGGFEVALMSTLPPTLQAPPPSELAVAVSAAKPSKLGKEANTFEACAYEFRAADAVRAVALCAQGAVELQEKDERAALAAQAPALRIAGSLYARLPTSDGSFVAEAMETLALTRTASQEDLDAMLARLHALLRSRSRSLRPPVLARIMDAVGLFEEAAALRRSSEEGRRPTAHDGASQERQLANRRTLQALNERIRDSVGSFLEEDVGAVHAAFIANYLGEDETRRFLHRAAQLRVGLDAKTAQHLERMRGIEAAAHRAMPALAATLSSLAQEYCQELRAGPAQPS